MIAIVDYQLGNLRSISAALERLDVLHVCTSEKKTLEQANGLILPGVGSFPDGMGNLKKLDLINPLNELVLEKQKPILGICLGFQLMATVGEEFEETTGLGWFDAKVVRLNASDSGVRIPHVGWNDCIQLKENSIFESIPTRSLFYYTHSFHMICHDDDDVTATSDHGQSFTAAIQKGMIFGTQFHPEKSQLHGLRLLKNFAEMVMNKC